MQTDTLKYTCAPSYANEMWANQKARFEQTEAQREHTAATVKDAAPGMILLAGGGRKTKYRK